MTQENQYPVTTQATTKKSTATKKEAPAKVKSGSKLSKLNSLLLIFTLAMLVLLGLWAYYKIERLDKAIGENSSQIDSITEVPDMVTFKENLYQRMQANSTEHEKLATETAELSAMLSELSRQQNRNQRDWVLAEAEYLLKIAAARVNLLRDVKSATLALQKVDESIASLNDPSLLKLREQLAHDIVELNIARKLDADGVLLRLTALSKQITQLPVAKIELEQAYKNDAKSEQPEPQKKSHKSIAELKRWLGYKKLPATAYRDTREGQQMFYIDQLLQLEIDAARYALLRLDKDNYQQHLTTARNLLEQHYLQQDEVVIKVNAQLVALMADKVFPTLPNLSGSQAHLKRAIASSKTNKKQKED